LFAGVFSALLWHAAVFYGSGRFWALGQHSIGANKLTSHTLERWKSQDDLERITQLLKHSLVGHHGLEVIVLSPNHDVIFATLNANFSLDLVATSAARSPHRPISTTQGEQNYRSIAAELPTSKAAEAVFPVWPFYESILPGSWFVSAVSLCNLLWLCAAAQTPEEGPHRFALAARIPMPFCHAL